MTKGLKNQTFFMMVAYKWCLWDSMGHTQDMHNSGPSVQMDWPHSSDYRQNMQGIRVGRQSTLLNTLIVHKEYTGLAQYGQRSCTKPCRTMHIIQTLIHMITIDVNKTRTDLSVNITLTLNGNLCLNSRPYVALCFYLSYI